MGWLSYWDMHKYNIKQHRVFQQQDSINSHSAGIDFKRQILTSKVDPRTVRVKMFIMVIYPWHRHSDEAERAD